MAGLHVGDSRLDEEIDVVVELVLESVPDGVVAAGQLRAGWTAPCNRCAEELRGMLGAEVREVFEPRPSEGESYPLGPTELDLEPMVRDALLLELPVVAHCPHPDADPCPLSGFSPSAWSETEAGGDGTGEPAARSDDGTGEDEVRGDPRWSALDELRFDE